MAGEVLIERKFLEKLERLAIRWQKSFPGLVGGHNASRFSGAGQEFLDHRNFHHGDDLRAVNWRAYMRLEKMFLKMFQVEPRVPVRMLVDASLSMTVGTPSKFDYGRRLAAALAYVGLVRLDSVLIHPFRETLGDGQPCSGGRHRFGPVADFLSNLEASGKTDFLQVSRQFVNKYVNRGLVIVISDFLSEADPAKPLQYLAEFGHEVLAIQIYAEDDRVPSYDGELELTDAETGEKVELDFDAEARAKYTAAFDEYSDLVRRAVIGQGGRYVAISTAMLVEEAVFGPVVRARGVA